MESNTYVQRQADDLLFQNLQNANFSYVLNSRQMGKSSLMLRTKQRLEKDGVGCVTIDLTDIGSQNITVTQWYRGFVDQIVDDLELEINWEQWWDQSENKGISTVQMFGDFIRKVLLPEVANNDGKAVIFVDEIDSIINLDFGTDDFFAFIRACHNKRAEFPLYNCLTFCLLGVATPSDLIADRRRTPFNIGTAIELTGFTFKEAKEALTLGLAEKVDNPEFVLKQVLDWTGGQPFLTQKLCNLIVNKAESSHPNIPQLVRTYMINNWEGQDNPEHLRTVENRLLANDKNIIKKLGLYQVILKQGKEKADNSKEETELLLSGLVVKRGKTLTVANKIYEKVFDASYIKTILSKKRPYYGDKLDAWIESNCKEQFYLLYGQELQDALKWAEDDKELSKYDNRFLTDSRVFDTRLRALVGDVKIYYDAMKVVERSPQGREIFNAIVDVPYPPKVYYHVGAALAKLHKWEEAVSFYNKFIESKPNHSGVRHRLGYALAKLQRLDEAVRSYHIAIEINGSSAEVNYHLGRALAEQKKWDEAIESYQDAREINPNLPEVHHYLGTALAQLQKWDEAAACYHKAFKLNPNSPEVNYHLGFALAKLQKWEGAVKFYRRAIALKLDSAQLYHCLGFALAKLEQWEEAVPAYYKARARSPRRPVVNYHLALALAKLQRWEDAVEEFCRVLFDNTTSTDLYNDLAEVLGQLQNWDEVLTERGDFLFKKKEPSLCSEIYSGLGAAFDRSQKSENAVICYRRAIEFEPDSAKAHHHLGNALEKSQKLDEAVTSYRRVLELKPNLKEVANHLEWLEAKLKMSKSRL